VAKGGDCKLRCKGVSVVQAQMRSRNKIGKDVYKNKHVIHCRRQPAKIDGVHFAQREGGKPKLREEGTGRALRHGSGKTKKDYEKAGGMDERQAEMKGSQGDL